MVGDNNEENRSSVAWPFKLTTIAYALDRAAHLLCNSFYRHGEAKKAAATHNNKKRACSADKKSADVAMGSLVAPAVRREKEESQYYRSVLR